MERQSSAAHVQKSEEEEEEGSIIDRGSLTPTFCIIAINSRDFKAFHLKLTLESNPLPLREDKTVRGGLNWKKRIPW